jgi:hypothetical protein
MCNPAHFRKLELSEVGVFRIDPARVDHFFPHLAPGNSYAVGDISIANRMKIGEREGRPWWRRPDGKMEPIVYRLALPVRRYTRISVDHGLDCARLQST